MNINNHIYDTDYDNSDPSPELCFSALRARSIAPQPLKKYEEVALVLEHHSVPVSFCAAGPVQRSATDFVQKSLGFEW